MTNKNIEVLSSEQIQKGKEEAAKRLEDMKDNPIPDTCEIIVNDKTYISKEMNPKRRTAIIQNVFSPGIKNAQNESIAEVIDVISQSFGQGLTDTMWSFIKDDDKEKIGTKEIFEDTITDKTCGIFMSWAKDKILEIQGFLV